MSRLFVEKLNQILSKKYLFVTLIIFCFIKAFYNMWQFTSLFTYIIFTYSSIVALKLLFINFVNKRIRNYILPVIFFILFFLSIIINGHSDLKFIITNFVLYFVNLFVLFIPDASMSNEQLNFDIVFFLKTLVLCINILSFIYILLRFYNLSIGKLEFFARYAGEFQHSNYPGWYSLIALAAIYLIYNSGLYKCKLYWIFSMLINLYVLIISQCRSAYIGILVLLFIHYILDNKMYNCVIKYKVIVFIIIIFTISSLVIVLILAFERGTSYRFLIYNFAINEFQKYNKIFGIGCGEILIKWKNDFEVFTLSNPEFNIIKKYAYEFNTHNSFLHELCLHGILGILLFVFMNIVIIIKTYLLFNNYCSLDVRDKFVFKVSLVLYVLPLLISMVDDAIFSNIIMFTNCIYFFSISYLCNLYEKYFK